MENATKALIIAAAILIAIVLISLGVFVLGQGTTMVKENSDMTATQATAYNNEIESYLGNKVSGSKVKQFINFINQHNRNAEDDSKKIELVSGGPSGTAVDISTGSEYQYTDKNVLTGEKYAVTVWPYQNGGYTSSGLIKKINIMKTY